MTPKEEYDARQRFKRERKMNAAEREKQADELAALAMTSLRAFLEGKASLHITQPGSLPSNVTLNPGERPISIGGGLTIVRFVMDPVR